MKRWMLCAVLLLAGSGLVEAEESGLKDIRLPEGFKISEFASIPGARSMAQGKEGTLFVGTREDSVYAWKAGQLYKIASGLRMPNGVAFRDGALYVAEIHRVLRFDAIEASLANPPKPVIVYDNYPQDRHHGWKFIRFGPDGKLYVPVGAPCNVCSRPDDKRYSSITRLDVDNKQVEVFAEGIRNTVGFDWHPETKELWFTDNGRDMMGDDLPSDELNRVPKAGFHFGFPFCHQGDTPDPEFGTRPCSEFVPPVLNVGPHVAALGMRFYTGMMFPAEYQNAIFIAQHGSWNRSKPIGYRVMVAKLKGNEAASFEPFAEGWLSKAGVSGRPVDVEVLPDGSMLISDDHAGKIYRVSYEALA